MSGIADKKESAFRIFFGGEGVKRAYDTAATGIGFVNSYITITYLTVFDFGLLQLLLSFVSILDSLNLDIFGGIVTVEMRKYFKAQKPDLAKRLFWENVSLKLVIAMFFTAAAFFGSEIIAGFYGQDVVLFIKIASLLLLIRAVFASEAEFLKALLNFSHWSFPAIRETGKLLIIVYIMMFNYLTSLTIIIAHVAAEAVAVLLITIFVFRKAYLKNVSPVRAARETLIKKLFALHGKWVAIRYSFSRVTKNFMPWFIKIFINTEAVAYYSLAIGIIGFAESLMPTTGVSTVMLMKSGNRGDIAFIFKRSVKYMFWLGIIFMFGGLLVLPPLVVFIFPKYGPVLPVLSVMLLAFPLYGVYKVLKACLNVLQEHKIMALRIMREALVVPAAAILFLPFLGIIGAGLVYNAIYWERTPFLYRKLTEKYPDFKIKFSELFRFDNADYDMLKRSWRRLKRIIPSLS